MTDTVNLGLPCIEGSQAQKHVTHNDALRILDSLVQLVALDRDLSTPPGSPAEGQRWIVKTGATGAWAGHTDAIAAWQDGAWQFSAPRTGWVAYVVDEGTLLAWNGAAWGDFFATVTALQNLAMLGLGTAADATNPLSAKLNNALFTAKTVAEGGDGNLRYKLSKESAAKTLSFLLQDNFSGRAEVGLTGDDDFHFKVSPDGSTWYEGIKIAASSGKVSFPASGGPREVLGTNRTYYVRTDGNDANNGLANTSGGAFLTWQAAYNAILGLDLNGHIATIQLADGTYTGGLAISSSPVGGNVVINGNSTTPANVVLSVTGGDAIQAAAPINLLLQNCELRTTTSGNCVNAIVAGAFVRLGTGMRLGSCAGAHLRAYVQGYIKVEANLAIVGGAQRHVLATSGMVSFEGITVTLTGTPAFSVTFADARRCGVIIAQPGTAFSGMATGPRYSVIANGVIDSAGGGASFFPGDSAGTTATGGQYA